MRSRYVALALSVCASGLACETPVGSGFEVLRYSSRNLLEAPITAGEDRLERHWHRQQADQAWQHWQHGPAGHPVTVHYERGFKDGFADYLYAGGTGQPPPVPPWTLRTAAFETPAGARAVEDWFAGFRQGASAARESGLRELVVVPSSSPPALQAAPAPATSQATPRGPSLETLPLPRELAVPEPPAADKPRPLNPE